MIPYFIGGITSVVPKGRVSLERMLKYIKEPSPEMITLIAHIRHAAQIEDKVRKTALKAKLPYFTPAVDVTYRNYQSILSFNGIGVLDFDKLESKDVAEYLKADLFIKHDSIIAAWLSASGTGVRALFKMPIVENVPEFKEYYLAFAVQMQQYAGYDNACIKPIQPLYYSYDTDILIRHNAKIWDEKHEIRPKRKRILIITEDPNDEPLINYAKNRIANIDEDGHPTLYNIVKNCQYYIDSGYVTAKQAKKLITLMIEENEYLSRPHKKNDYLRILNILKDEGENI